MLKTIWIVSFVQGGSVSTSTTGGKWAKVLSLAFCFVLLAGTVIMPAARSETADRWVIETVDSAGDVGRYNSLKISSDGAYHIAYLDAENGHLKYASNASGSLSAAVLDSSEGSGYFTSMDLDAQGRLHIAYTTATGEYLYYLNNMSGAWVRQEAMRDYKSLAATSIADDGKGNVYIAFHSSLREDAYYVCNAYRPSIPWQYHDFYGSANVGEHISMVMDVANKTYSSFYDSTNKDLLYNSNFVQGIMEKVDSDGDVGQFTSIGIDASATPTPFISYYDVGQADLKLAYREPGPWPGVWNKFTLDSAGDVGKWSSIAVDADRTVHIAYYDATYGDLKYLRWQNGATAISTVDSEGDVGTYASIALDPQGRPCIAYYDATKGDLKMARMVGSEEVPPQYAPGPPMGLRADPGSADSIRLTWDWSAGNVSQPEVTGYRVLVNSSQGEREIVLGNVTSYLDLGLDQGVSYQYRVKAVNRVGESAASLPVNATIPLAPGSLYAPPMPSGLRTDGVGNDSVHLVWDEPALNASTPPITAYRIFRGASPSSTALIAVIGNQTEFQDEGLTPGVSYLYYVTAVNQVGISPSCYPISAMPSAADGITYTTGGPPVLLILLVIGIVVAVAVLFAVKRKRS
jgi:hypothetical protein